MVGYILQLADYYSSRQSERAGKRANDLHRSAHLVTKVLVVEPVRFAHCVDCGFAESQVLRGQWTARYVEDR